MKLYKLSLALILGLGLITSCNDKLDISNPNQQTSETFGNNVDELEECVIAAYNHIRMEGTYARVGYNLDVTRGDEVWNASQVWYLPFDDLNDPVTDEINQWSWRDWYYTINVCNFILSHTSGDSSSLSTKMQHIKGQALFIRGLAYYNLAGYYQNPALITDYAQYGTLDGLYASNHADGDADGNAQYDRVLDQVEADFTEAMSLLPSKTEGGEWAKGRATAGAAAGYYARTLMVRHKYAEALTVLKDIMSTADGGNEKYGTYKLMANYGDNFREGSEYENNDESLFEIQFLDYGTQGVDDEWTPVNTSPNATQGSAIESNYGPGDGGLPIAKNTNLRTGLYDKVVTGLHDGINLRLMRYSDVLLRAAECENEINGPTADAFKWIDKVRNRAQLANLDQSKFNTKDLLFEQIANVERPKEFGCEFGRGFDLIRWGFFYAGDRLNQLKAHGAFNVWKKADFDAGKYTYTPKDPVDPSSCSKSSFNSYVQGHEFLPIYQNTLNDNPNLTGNSANKSTSNASYFSSKGWTIHQVPTNN